jgi:hypothetical protein
MNIQNNQNIQVIYRISDGGQNDPSGNKQMKGRPVYFNKRKLLESCINIFGISNMFIVADNVTDDTMNYLNTLINDTTRIFNTNFKSGALSFLYAVELAIKSFSDDQIVYLVEDDYIHRKNCNLVIADAFNNPSINYVTAYDHPDKYIDPQYGGNPYIQNRGEISKVFVGKYAHYKVTNSTTMTFACKVNTLKAHYDIYNKYCHTGYPHDFEMFIDLYKNKNICLVSSIPAYSTHCETDVLSPLINWENE